MKRIVLICTVAIMANGLHPVFAQNQVITPSPLSQSVAQNSPVNIDINYSTTHPVNENLTGLGLRLHWDSTKLTLVGLTSAFADGAQPIGSTTPDNADLDGDVSTDSYVVTAWLKAGAGWPGPIPRLLYTANFNTAGNFSASTHVNFSTSSVAAGADFVFTRSVVLSPIPARPTGIKATDGTLSGRVRVTFNPVAGATVYRVFRCPDRGNSCGLPIGYPKSGTFDDKKGNPGTVYYYRVRACTKTNCGKFSVANTGFSRVVPDKPTGIKATDGVYADRVRVSFIPVAAATVYRVFRCLDKGLTCGLPVGFPKTENFDDKKGDSGIVYYYRVRACTATACSRFSVANAGHRGSPSSTDVGGHAAIEVQINDVAIPTLNGVGRFLLILITLGLGCLVPKAFNMRTTSRC